MAKLRGFILNLDKEDNVLDVLLCQGKHANILKEQNFELPAGCSNLGDFILLNCERNEGLQKLYSFHTIESLVAKLQAVKPEHGTWLMSAIRLLIKNLEYPLHSVASCCEAITRRLLMLSTSEQIGEVISVIKGLSSRHEIKAKYTALSLALPHMDA